MKKILALCLVVILCFALVGCNNNEDVVNDGNNPPVEDNQNQENENLGENEENPDVNNGEDEVISGEVSDDEVSGEVSGDELPEVDPASASGVMTELMTAANIQVMAPMQDVIPAEMTESYIGLESGDFEAYVTDSVFYESMISPANQSFCIIKVNDETKVEELKQKIFDNCNPRKWICMTAERVVVLNSGEYVMLAMASQDSCNALIPAFEAKFGKDNVGTILDKTVSESIENVEDLPGGGMAL